MTALSSTQVNEVLDRYNPAQRFDVLRCFLKQKRSYQERTLRSHSDPIKEEDEIEVRYNLDELLEMAGAIEIVALATGALPELEAEFQTQMLSILCNDAIRNYYSAIYPLPLPILLRHQLTDPKSNTSAWSPIQRACSDRKNESFAFLLTFFELETRRRRSRVLELFFDLLDAYVINHAFSMADLLKILGDKKSWKKSCTMGRNERIWTHVLCVVSTNLSFSALISMICATVARTNRLCAQQFFYIFATGFAHAATTYVRQQAYLKNALSV